MSIDGRNIVIMNDAVSEENINFGNIGKIEINFIEMERQSNKINDLGVTIGKKMNIIINAINELAGLVGSSVNIDLRAYSKKFLNKTQSISNFMKKQMNNYIEVNNFTEYKIFQLNNLIKQLYDEDGLNINYINKNGNIVTVKYQEILENRNRSYTTSGEYDYSDLMSVINYFESGNQNGAEKYEVVINGENQLCYKVIVDTDGGLAAGPGMHLSNIKGINSGSYKVGDYIPANIVDQTVEDYLRQIRTQYESLLASDFKDLNMTDNQIDALVSLSYNARSATPENMLERYREAISPKINKSMYEYCTKNWANGTVGTEVVPIPALARRRKSENILFEEGYDAWRESLG